MQNCLLSIDLNTTRITEYSYNNLINSLQAENLEIHLYNFIEHKHNKLNLVHNEQIHKYMGSKKKVALDIPQALDIVELCTKNYYDKVFILCGEYESDFLYTKLNQLAINYVKINPTNLRQIEEKFVCTELKNKNSESFRNLQDNQTNHLQLNTITNQTSDSVKHEEIDNEITNTFKVVKTSNHSYDSDLICKKEEFSKPATKLTPEQIKKIYTYIKLKQLKQALNKAE